MYYLIHFSPTMGYIVPLLFFNKDAFAIKYFLKVDMPLNKDKKLPST